MLAALTLPILTENVRGIILQNQLKKAYSVMSQALEQFHNDGGLGSYYENTACNTTSSYGNNGMGCTGKAFSDKDYFKNLP